MAKQTLQTIKNWFVRGAKPTQAQFSDTFDSFRHKDDKVASADLATDVISAINGKASVVHTHAINDVTNLQLTLQNKADADYFGHESGNQVYMKDDNGNEIIEKTASNLVQIDYPNEGNERPAIQITENQIQLKLNNENSTSVCVIDFDFVQLKAGFAELKLDKNEGATYLSGYLNLNGSMSTPRLGWVQEHDNDQNNSFKFYIDSPEGDSFLKYAVDRLRGINYENNFSLKIPCYDDDYGDTNNFINANTRRFILYHPNGNQFIHSNPDGVQKDGTTPADIHGMTIYYPNGIEFIEADLSSESEPTLQIKYPNGEYFIEQGDGNQETFIKDSFGNIRIGISGGGGVSIVDEGNYTAIFDDYVQVNPTDKFYYGSSLTANNEVAVKGDLRPLPKLVELGIKEVTGETFVTQEYTGLAFQSTDNEPDWIIAPTTANPEVTCIDAEEGIFQFNFDGLCDISITTRATTSFGYLNIFKGEDDSGEIIVGSHIFEANISNKNSTIEVTNGMKIRVMKYHVSTSWDASKRIYGFDETSSPNSGLKIQFKCIKQ